jgi:hypothetical protein
MNDDVQPPDTPSDELVAVNAVLDGTATADQRALVDSSTELTELLGEFDTTRLAIAQVDVPDGTRGAAIAAALAAFDEMHAHVERPPNVPNVVVFERRNRWNRSMLGAAAAVILVVGAVAALSTQGGSDSDDSETAAMSPAATALDSDQKESGEASTAADATVTMDAPAAAVVPALDSAADGGAGRAESTDAASTTAAESPPPEATIGEIPAGGAEAGSPPSIDDDDELAAFASTAEATPDARTAQCAPTGSDQLGEINYRGTPGLVARDPDTGEITVFAVADCEVLTTLAP